MLFRYPLKNTELLNKWVAAVRRDKWNPQPSDVLCSEHFDNSCFRTYRAQVRLIADAVPSIFQFPDHLKSPTSAAVPRRCITRHVPSSVSPAEETSVPVFASGEHNYVLQSSPHGIKRKYEEMLAAREQRNTVTVRRLKGMRRKLFRKHKSLQNMKDVIKSLKSRNDINKEAVNLIEQCFGTIPAELLKRKLHGVRNQAYTDIIRSFAMTLHFYSAKAYSFVRSSFRAALPHPSTLRKWCTTVNGQPGFTGEAFEVYCHLYWLVVLIWSGPETLVLLSDYSSTPRSGGKS